VEFILKNPYLKRFLSEEHLMRSIAGSPTGHRETLEAIYLDTASMTCTEEIPAKVSRSDCPNLSSLMGNRV
jgi:hypothetical protein